MDPDHDLTTRRTTMVAVGAGVVAVVVVGLVAVFSSGGGLPVVAGPPGSPSPSPGPSPLPEPGDQEFPLGSPSAPGELVSEVRFDAVRTDASGRSLLVSFVGSQAGDGPCSADYGAEVDQTPGRVVVGLGEVDTDRPQLSQNETCTDLGYPRALVFELAAPLGDRSVVDATSGIAHIPIDGASLLAPSRLPPGWTLEWEGGLSDPASTRYWQRTYGPPGTDGPGVAVLQGAPSLGPVDDLSADVELVTTVQGVEATVTQLRDLHEHRSVRWVADGVSFRVDALSGGTSQGGVSLEELLDIANSLE